MTKFYELCKSEKMKLCFEGDFVSEVLVCPEKLISFYKAKGSKLVNK
jgi:hypothetical protein